MKNTINDNAVAAPAELSAAKQALLAKWLRGRAPEERGAKEDCIPRRKNSGPAPLSFEQQRLWFFHQLDPNGALYTMPIAMKLSGALNTGALQNALNFVASRHEALRTVFVGEEPAQVVRPPQSVPMIIFDFRNFPESQRETEARRALEAEAKRPFDLANDSMVRAALAQVGESEWIFLVLMHHIASDDWSWRIFCNDLATAYSAAISDQRIVLPDLPIQYSDFAVWQKQWLRGEVLENQLAFWRHQLAGAPAVLELPTDFPCPAAQTFRGASEWLKIPSGIGGKLNALNQRAGVTPFMTLLAAFQTLLHRYIGRDDIIVGSPVAGRTRASVENLVGMFVNMIVLRANLKGEPTFSEFLRRVQSNVLEALAHQEMPFEKLVEELQPQRSASHSPIIQVMFAFQDELSDNLQLPGVAITPFALDTGTAKFDLTFTIVKSGAELNCCAEFNTDLFERTTIRRMLGHYEKLLEGIAANPNQRLCDLPLLTGSEREQLLVQWNRTEMVFPRNQCVQDLFEAQASETPDAIAITFEKHSLTYHDLNQRANRLAHHLIRLGIGPETLVAIGMERSLDLIVALLGVLKAGGAYVPLDLSYPAERFRFMLEDSGASLLLTRQSEQARLGNLESPNLRVIRLDADWPKIELEREENPRVEMKPENLAYVIYTSGSTGWPKGVQIPHRAVVNFLHSMRREPGLSRDDRLLSVTSISFDIAALEIFLPLSVGARLVLASADEIADATRLASLIANSGATVMQATPSLWRFLVDFGWRGNQRLRIFCGGESLTRELADKLLERSASVWNLYGPTETTIWSTLCKVEKGNEPISIGRPIANTKIYLLDDRLQPVPIGVPAELHIGGEGLARGYLNRPELTAEKFISDPFNKNQTARLYKTGDIARYRADGKIECLGRSDSQIKLRGHRIDLGEIESTMRKFPGIRDALVALHENSAREKNLFAYLICADGVLLNTDELRRVLKEKLPDYMVPSGFVTLEKFPMTPNGKVNRNALPKPETPGFPAQKFVEPRTPLEKSLVEIWRDVLQSKQIGIEDNFFEIGGHSLLAMQMISRARKVLGMEISLREIFEAPTISGLAKILTRKTIRPADPIPRQRRISPRQAKELLSRLNELSNAEVESLLERVPAEQGNRV
ncbi:MAG TPA: amino acid adenylation domain-containing protein [Verrucomicrobiae bacterium]|nr:amino acid adenylation domain-containing protein [Verrucomicrobiae bacterium]